MASQRFIADREDEIIRCRARTRLTHEAVQTEVSLADNGKVYPENRDHWNSLMVNADDLKRQLTQLIEELNKSL